MSIAISLIFALGMVVIGLGVYQRKKVKYGGANTHPGKGPRESIESL